MCKNVPGTGVPGTFLQVTCEHCSESCFKAQRAVHLRVAVGAAHGQAGESLLAILESRLDNVVFRLGFAKSRDEARQTVRHNHITVNGRKVNIPSFRVKPGDLVAVAPKAKDLLPIKSALISNERTEVPGWLEVDIEKLQGSVLSLPTREQIDLDIREQLIVELYSK